MKVLIDWNEEISYYVQRREECADDVDFFNRSSVEIPDELVGRWEAAQKEWRVIQHELAQYGEPKNLTTFSALATYLRGD